MEVKFPKVNGKLAFFDFDRTLVMHDYSREYVKAYTDSYFMDCIYSLTSAVEEHMGDRPLPCMQWYAKKLFDEGYGLYCLTHEIFNLRDGLKQRQLREFYPETPMTYLTVDSAEHKIDMMQAVAMVEGCRLSDVVFVDDKASTVKLAVMAGIDGKHLSDIVVMYEAGVGSDQQGVTMRKKSSSLGAEVTDGKIGMDILAECGLSDEDLDKTFRECRRMIERGNKKNERGLGL